MKISPIDIRQHTFEKGFRGYNIDEVNAFLNSLSQEWERVINENKMLKMQLEIAEKELNKLKDVEMTLFRTLKTAEDTSSQITEQANKAAEKYLQESRQKSDDAVNEAKRKASMLLQDAENEAKYIKEEIINELKNQERDFKAMEKYRDNLIVQLKSLVNNTNETVERFEKKFNKDSFGQRMEEIKEQIAGAGNVTKEEKQEESEVPLEVEETSETTMLASEAEVLEEDEQQESSEPTAEVETEKVAEPAVDLEEPTGQPEEVVAEASQEEEKEKEEKEKKEEATEDTDEAESKSPASEALAEIEKMSRMRKESEAANAVTKEEDSKNKGSFFDQIR
jgi:cell division initiation protein